MLYRFVLLLLCAVGFISCGGKPESANPPKKDSPVKVVTKVDSLRAGLRNPSLMNVSRSSAFNSFFVRIRDSMYYCSYKGLMESADTLGKNKKFLFDIKAEYVIDRIFLYQVDPSHFFVAWQETDHLGVQSYFARYERGNSTPIWKMKSNAPSPGPPVIDSPFVYVSTLGMIAKLDVNTGNPSWKHDSLFDPLKLVYKEFERPLVYNHSVCFYDIPIRGRKNRRDSLWVNDATGRLGK